MTAIRTAVVLAVLAALALSPVAANAAKKTVKVANPIEGKVNFVVAKSKQKPRPKLKQASAAKDLIAAVVISKRTRGGYQALYVTGNRRNETTLGGSKTKRKGSTKIAARRPLKKVSKTLFGALFKPGKAKKKGCRSALRKRSPRVLATGGLAAATAKEVAKSLFRAICGKASADDRVLLNSAGLDIALDGGGGDGGDGDGGGGDGGGDGGGNGDGGGDPLGTPQGRIVHAIAGMPGQIFRTSAEANATPENLSTLLDGLSPGDSDEDQNVSPDGQWITLKTDRFGCSGYPCLALVRGDVSAGEPILTQTEFGSNGAGDYTLHGGFTAVANGGDRIIFADEAGPHTFDLWVVNRLPAPGAGGREWSDPVLLTGSSPAPYNGFPALSDDGSKLLFDCGQAMDPNDGELAICEVNADGTGLHLVADKSSRPDPHVPGSPPELHSADYVPGGGIVFEATWGAEWNTWYIAEPGAGAAAGTPVKLPSSSGNQVAACALPSGHVAALDLARPGGGVHEIVIGSPTSSEKLYPLLGVDVLDWVIGCGA